MAKERGKSRDRPYGGETSKAAAAKPVRSGEYAPTGPSAGQRSSEPESKTGAVSTTVRLTETAGPNAVASITDAAIESIRAARRPVRRQSPEEAEELTDLFANRWMGVDALHDLERTSGKHFKRGRFSVREKETIRQALDNFCASRGLSRDDFINAFFMRKERGGQRYSDERFRELFLEVAKCLHGRPVLLVYQCMRRMYHPGNRRGAWSTADDTELRRLFLQHGPDWETIGLAMGRYGMSVRDRYRLLRGRGATGPWSEEEVDRLRAAVATVRQLTSSPSWLLVSEGVGTRSVPQCILKWTLLEAAKRSGGRRPAWTRSLDYYLVSRLYDLALEDESEVRWRTLADEGWPVYLGPRDLQLRWRILRKRVPHLGRAPLSFDDTLESLLLSLRPLSANTVSDEDAE